MKTLLIFILLASTAFSAMTPFCRFRQSRDSTNSFNWQDWYDITPGEYNIEVTNKLDSEQRPIYFALGPQFVIVNVSGVDYLVVNPLFADKRRETYSGTTNASGLYTVTFVTAFSVAPNIQLQPTNFSSDNQFARVTTISTTGFTVIARLRTDVLGLLPSFTNITGATVDVLITEK